MKRNISNIISGIAAAAAFAGLWSCSAENPFDSEGSGIVQLRTVVNSITTRAEGDAQSDLEKKCVIYISDKNKPTNESLVYQKVGLENLDTQITLKAGNYVAEAWTGDSVSASFDKKFYRGYQEFDVTKGSTSNVVVNCRIANVVVSIDATSVKDFLDRKLINDDYTVTINNTRGEKTFTKDSLDQRAYFMMPNGVDSLNYTVSGTRPDGNRFDYSGTIRNVERAHHYILSFEYNPTSSDNPLGYVFIKINIKEEEIENDNVTIFTRPTITGVDFDLEKQLKFIDEEDIPELVSIQICGSYLDDIRLTPVDECGWKEILGLDVTNDNILSGKRPVILTKIGENDPIISLFRDKGIEYIPPHYNDTTKIETAHLKFRKDLFMRLTESDKEHKLEIYVSDSRHQESTAVMRTARTEQAVEVADPIEITPVAQNDWQSIKVNSVNLNFKLSDSYEGTPGVEYAKENDDNWTFVAAPIAALRPETRAENDYVITITGLDEGTTYKYRACCGEFHSQNIYTFTTESKFIIPNASMEDWSELSSNAKVILPSSGGSVSFWDSGNHGSATMNKTLTQGSENMKHSGNKAAELVSQFVGIGIIGKFAAGNLFAGSYDKTDGTDGELTFGRPYNGSHPIALSFWANYRPGKGVKNKGANSGYIDEGQLDNSQIYVALSTKPISIKTKNDPDKDIIPKLFDKDAPEILAYGEVTWKDNFGPDGGLQQVSIPLEYYNRARTEEAKYLIIVCSASKFGDFFSGGEKSTMYLDDFELIYE